MSAERDAIDDAIPPSAVVYLVTVGLNSWQEPLAVFTTRDSAEMYAGWYDYAHGGEAEHGTDCQVLEIPFGWGPIARDPK